MADSLPFYETPIGYPYCGVAANVNVQTMGHRDSNDAQDNSFISSWGCSCGGQVILAEARLIIHLAVGDGMSTPSESITHLNKGFTGDRLSFVFHTDQAMEKWKSTSNGYTYFMN
jgi:hypothetical protein